MRLALGALLGAVLMTCGLPAACPTAHGQPQPKQQRAAPSVVRNVIWIWGNPEMTTPGKHALATFAQAGPAERAALLGIPNVIMAGNGLPNDDKLADKLTEEVAHCPRLLWEITADGDGGPPFVYTERTAQVRRLVDKYPRIEGVVLDDMSSVGIDKGFKPEHIRRIRELLTGKYAAVKIWGVVYTMNLARPNINDYIKELDVIMLPEWFGDKVGELEKHVAHCERLFPDKPIVLCTYLYDYGAGKRMSLNLLDRQFEIALRLLHAGRIKGIEITTITNDPEALSWTADWIKRVGNRKLGSK